MRFADTWVANGDKLSFGTFPQIINTFEPKKACSAGAIQLPVGDISRGYVHIQKHDVRIKNIYAGMSSIEYILLVCAGYTEIYYQNKTDTFLLKKYNGIKSAIVASHSDGIYQIITAFPVVRDFDHKRRKEDLIWSRRSTW